MFVPGVGVTDEGEAVVSQRTQRCSNWLRFSPPAAPLALRGDLPLKGGGERAAPRFTTSPPAGEVGTACCSGWGEQLTTFRATETPAGCRMKTGSAARRLPRNGVSMPRHFPVAEEISMSPPVRPSSGLDPDPPPPPRPPVPEPPEPEPSPGPWPPIDEPPRPPRPGDPVPRPASEEHTHA